MKIELKEITVRELAKGYQDKAEDGVVGLWWKIGYSPTLSEGIYLQGQTA